MSNLTLLAPALEESRVRLRVVVTQTTSATLAVADSGKAITNAGATTNITYTLPPAVAGRLYEIRNATDAYTLTVAPNGSDRIGLAIAGAPTVLPPRTIVVLECHSSGRWTIATDTRISMVYNVRDYGAVGDGVTDDYPAIEACRAAMASIGVMYFPEGDYRMSAGITLTGDYLTIRGDGPRQTRITYTGTTGTCIKFARNPTTFVQYYCGISNLSFHCTDTSATKTALEFVDAGISVIDNVVVVGWYGGDSVGVYTKGREGVTIIGGRWQATIPWRIGVNPNSSPVGWLSADLFKAIGTHLLAPQANAPTTLPHACVLVDDATNINNLELDTIVMIGGKYGFYWNGTTVPTGKISYGITFNNCRKEQTPTDVTGCVDIYIVQPTGSKMEMLSLRDWKGELQTATVDYPRTSLYVRGVRSVTIDNASILGGANVTVLDVDDVDILSWRGLYHASASTFTIGADLRMAYGMNGNGFPQPFEATYIRQSPFLDARKPTLRIGDASIFTYRGSFTNNQARVIPLNADVQNVRLGMVEVSATDGSTVAEAMHCLIAPVGGTNGVTKVSGTANTAVTDTDTALCLYASAGLTSVTVKNRLGVTCDILIRATYYRTVNS